MAHVVAVDLGTQTCKATVYDDALAARGVGRVAIATTHPRPGWAEQDPRAWERAVGVAIAAALADAGLAPAAISALGFTGQLDGMIAVDAAGAPLSPCWPWLDRRAGAALPALDRDRFHATTGQVADPSHLAAKARHWDRTGGGPRAACFHAPVSYLVARATGARVIDPGQASTTMLFELATGAWDPALCAAFDLDPARLPTIAPATARAGALHAAGAALTGLPLGTPVAVGTGDDFATPIGIALAERALLCAVGTAEVVGARGPIATRDPARLVETHPYPLGGGFVENPGWAAGGAMTWLGRLTGQDAAALDRAAAAVAPGADGVSFVPALGGAMVPRWDPAARAAFVGLGPGHGVGHLARAVYEACAIAMAIVAEHLAARGVPTDTVALVGGGARADTWAQVRADVGGRPVARYADADACPRGAAILAIAARDGADAIDAIVARAPRPIEWLEPTPAHAARYAEARAQLVATIDALAPIDHAHAARG
ncbi:MAG: FGGY-family carbohydrate kinase [Myxococcales bacterium]|nr:FGGY-family carbohydrate kinase [Myxococcales bacterium]